MPADEAYAAYLESQGIKPEPAKVFKRSFEQDVHAPVIEFARYGEWEVVGNGKQTNDRCGVFLNYMGCLHVEGHCKVTLDGVNHAGKVYVKKGFHYCDKPTCPVCFRRGWAVREAGNIESRLREGEKRFGLIEHVVVSVPRKDYGLSFEAMRSDAVDAMKARGVLGGVMIFHAFRYHCRDETFVGERAGWFLSPHFHVLGFVDGGYGRCRNCSKSTCECLRCGGFEGLTRRCFNKDGYIVKVLAKRESVFGTAWYQLNHASVKRGVNRFHVATWFGTCSYRRLKLKKGDRIRRGVCPICGEELERVRFVGVGVSNSDFWVREFEDDYLDGRGVPRWIPWVER